MIRRVLIVVLALVVAVVGGVVTFTYAAGADARAMAGMQPTRVLVVDQPIPAGTPAEDVADMIAVTQLPASAVTPGTVQDLSDMAGMVTSADLAVGEQLLASRFAEPDALSTLVEVPEGMHVLSFELPPNRVVGGVVEAGDRIAVFVSEAEAEDATRLLLHSVLVLDVTGGSAVVVDEQTGAETEQGPAATIMLTVALPSQQAQQLVYSVEYELVYLALEPETADQGDYGLLRDVIGQ